MMSFRTLNSKIDWVSRLKDFLSPCLLGSTSFDVDRLYSEKSSINIGCVFWESSGTHRENLTPPAIEESIQRPVLQETLSYASEQDYNGLAVLP